MHTKIKKRDGRLLKFNAEKITMAIAKAGTASGEFNHSVAKTLTIRVLNLADKIFDNRITTVEEIQDIVEEVLLSSPYRKTAKAYIIYREQHARLREITNKMEVDLVDQYLKKMDWKINLSAQKNYQLIILVCKHWPLCLHSQLTHLINPHLSMQHYLERL